MTDDITQWLGAQLDEDERIARAASPGPWHANAEQDEVLADDGIAVADGFALSVRQLRATTQHIAEHDPARVLREIDAKRRIAELHDYYRSESLGNAPACFLCGPGFGWPCPTMRALALPYVDRPGWREEWRP